MGFCCITGCSSTHNKTGDKRHFYRLPKVITNQCNKTRSLSEQRRKLWLTRINRTALNTEYSRVCDLHFLSGRPSVLFDELNVDWAPSLKLEYDCRFNTELQNQRYQRKMNRRKACKVTSTATSKCKKNRLKSPGIKQELPDQMEEDTGEQIFCNIQDIHIDFFVTSNSESCFNMEGDGVGNFEKVYITEDMKIKSEPLSDHELDMQNSEQNLFEQVIVKEEKDDENLEFLTSVCEIKEEEECFNMEGDGIVNFEKVYVSEDTKIKSEPLSDDEMDLQNSEQNLLKQVDVKEKREDENVEVLRPVCELKIKEKEV